MASTSTSPRAAAAQLLLVLSLLLSAASASSLLPPNNAHQPRPSPAAPAAKAREEGGGVSAGLISTLRETLDAIRGVASIISSFPIGGGGILGGGGGDLRLASAVADCLDLLDLSSDELSWSMSTTTSDDYSPAGAGAEAGGRLVGTGDARSDLRSWLSGALGNQDTCKEGLARRHGARRRHLAPRRRPRPGRRWRGRVVLPSRHPRRSRPTAVGAREGAAAAADARGARGPAGGRRGGAGRERQLHDGERGRGGGAIAERGAARDLREEGRVQGDGGGEEEEVEPDAGRRRHGRHGHLRPPQLRRWLHHLPQRHRRCERQGLHRAGPDVREHGGSIEAPGRGAAVRLGPLRLLPLRLRGVPGHAVRALAPPLLPRLPRHGHRRLRLRQRRRRVPELLLARAPPAARPEELRHRAGPPRRQHDHGIRLPVLQRLRPRRPPQRDDQRHRRGGAAHADVPRPAMEAVLPGGVHAVLHRRPGAPRGVARVGRGLRARHALLRRVHQHRARRRRRRAGQVARVPRHDQPHRGRQLHRRAVHRGQHVVAAHRRQVHRRPHVLIS